MHEHQRMQQQLACCEMCSTSHLRLTKDFHFCPPPLPKLLTTPHPQRRLVSLGDSLRSVESSGQRRDGEVGRRLPGGQNSAQGAAGHDLQPGENSTTHLLGCQQAVSQLQTATLLIFTTPPPLLPLRFLPPHPEPQPVSKKRSLSSADVTRTC